MFKSWFSGTPCAECGNRIEGQKIARTVMGATVWVCEKCEENFKAASRREREAAAQEQAAAAIAQRSDADIAEAMSMIVLREYETFCKEISGAAGGAVGIQHVDAFTFVLAASAHVFRGFLLPQLGIDRLNRIEERMTGYAFGGLIHRFFRNPPEEPKGSGTVDRGKMLSSFCEAYPRTAKIHHQNLMKLSGGHAIAVYFTGLAGRWFDKDYVDSLMSSDKSRAVALTQCAARLWTRGMSVTPLLQPQLATIPTSVRTNIEIDLPDSWLFRGGVEEKYYDPAMPQYLLWVSGRSYPRSGDGPMLETARAFLRVISPGTEPVPLTSERTIGRYFTDPLDKGEPREQRNWQLVQRTDRHFWIGLFTLSVLLERADSAATEAIAAMLDDRIQRARFVEESNPQLNPSSP